VLVEILFLLDQGLQVSNFDFAPQIILARKSRLFSLLIEKVRVLVKFYLIYCNVNAVFVFNYYSRNQSNLLKYMS